MLENSIGFSVVNNIFLLDDFSVYLIPVILSASSDAPVKIDRTLQNSILIYEDLWYTKQDIVKNRLLARFGRGEVLFARKCSVRKIETLEARSFLEENHMLGYSRAKYKYGLFNGEAMVAVATFSASRPMKRNLGIVDSYEWVRYAAEGSLRITGGMGKLLSFFVQEQNPHEIMSYADSDWSKGDAYLKLGFEFAGRTAPLVFVVNSRTFKRVTRKKLLMDKKYRDQELEEGNAVLLTNSGNFKFIRTFPFL